MATPKSKTVLVLIDAKTLTYSRFVGRESTNIVVAEAPLLPNEIELFRTNPAAVLPDPPAPEAA